MRRLLIFGYGFAGAALVRRMDGWTVSATSRSPETRARMAAAGLDAIDPADPLALGPAVMQADAVLIAAPPREDGCPGLAALSPHLGPAAAAPWVGYLSTTGVYGDQGGGWVREETSSAPASAEGRRRVEAEAAWHGLASAAGTALFVLRLPGIYGPGRSPLDRVRAGHARRLVKPGQVFSRIHVDDLADAIAQALARPQRAGIYNICDDEPAAAADVTAYAAQLLDTDPPPEEPFSAASLSPMAQRFWAESKRVSNARAKAALGWRPAHPTYREGLRAVLAVERLASTPSS